MATNSNQPLSSAAFEANEGEQEKGLIGPGEVDKNAKGEGVLLSDCLDSEQGKKLKAVTGCDVRIATGNRGVSRSDVAERKSNKADFGPGETKEKEQGEK